MKKHTYLTSAIIACASAQMAMAVNTIDLTAGGDAMVNGGYVITVDQQSTGTGVIQSFVRINPPGNQSPEEGYNASRADGVVVMDDVNKSPSFTRDLLLSEVPIVTDPGTATGDYYEFLLDINNLSASPLLSLDQVRIFTRDTAMTDASTLALLVDTSSERWSLDVGPDGDSEILLNYDLNSGSGSGDMILYVPVTAFAGAEGDDFLYLYSQFGSKGEPYESNDGFEEWAVRDAVDGPPPPSVPDGGSSLALIGLACLGLEAFRRKARA